MDNYFSGLKHLNTPYVSQVAQRAWTYRYYQTLLSQDLSQRSTGQALCSKGDRPHKLETLPWACKLLMSLLGPLCLVRNTLAPVFLGGAVAFHTLLDW